MRAARWIAGVGLPLLLGATGASANLALAQPTTDAGTDSAAAFLQQPLPLDPKVTLITLGNGMRAYLRVNHEPRDRAELRLAVNAGSVLEQDDQQGLAHFVEHMAFNGTKHFRAQELVNYLERVGMRFGADINAHTGFDETVYTLTVPTDKKETLEKAFQILEDWARYLSFDDGEIDKERGVVIEEWRLGRGANQRIRDAQYPVLLHDSIYASRLPIGQKQILETFPHEAARRFYRQWYRPELMAVVAVGDFDSTAVRRLVTRHFARIAPSRPPVERQPVAVPAHEQTLFSIVSDPEATTSRVSVTAEKPHEMTRTVADLRRDLVEGLWEGMFNARLSELRQRPDPPFLGAGAGEYNLVRSVDAASLSAFAKDNGVLPALRALLTEAARVHEHGFTATELERSRKNLLRSLKERWLEREKTDSSVYADLYVDNYLDGDPAAGIEFNYAAAQRLVPGITLEEVNAVTHDWLGESNRVVLVSGPRKEGVTLPTEQELREAFVAADTEQVTPWVDQPPVGDLVPEPPASGSIAREETFPDLGVTLWVLSNGARVWLKPTDFQQDELVLAATSPGGTSLAADSVLTSAEFASSIVAAGGVGQLSMIELRKALAGKSVGASPIIGALTEGMRGHASLADAPTLFQLVYLYFTQPRRDEEAFASLRSRFADMLANSANDPESAFRDTLSVTLAQHHPRVQPLTSARIASLNLDQAFAFYRARFADASDFTFALVGSFDPEQLRPLILQYLGGLPTLHRHETFADHGVRPPAGVVHREVHRGAEPKSRTQIVFTGPFEWTRENRYAMESLEDVLSLRLREVLREDLGGTYGVSVNAQGQRDPDPEYTVAISFGADPARLTELTDTTFAVLRELKTLGPSADEIAKVREAQKREYETALRENDFWASQLLFRDRYGLDPEEILTYPALVDRLSAETLRDAARRYLHEDRYVQVSLLPEEGQSRTP